MHGVHFLSLIEVHGNGSYSDVLHGGVHEVQLVVRPGNMANDSSSHGVHEEEPGVSEYAPAGHVAHSVLA